jgi:hypothetical protein
VSNWKVWMSSRWWPAECGYCHGEFYLKVPWDIHLLGSVRAPFYAVVLVILWMVNVWLFLAWFVVVVGVEGIGRVWGGQVVRVARADT